MDAPLGKGLQIDLTPKRVNAKYVCDLVLKDGTIAANSSLPAEYCHPTEQRPITYKEPGTSEDVDEGEDDVVDKSSIGKIGQTSNLFSCPNDLCSGEYILKKNCDKHVERGVCFTRLRKVSIKTKMKRQWFSRWGGLDAMKLKNGNLNPYFKTHLKALKKISLPVKLILELPHLQIDCSKHGFALTKAKKITKFTDDQRAFCQEIFDKGMEEKQQKLTATEASVRMQTARNPDGSYRFSVKEWMSEEQIMAQFSKMLAKIKKKKNKGKKSSDSEEKLTQAELDEASGDLQLMLMEEATSELASSLQSGAIDQQEEKAHPITVSSGILKVQLKMTMFL